MRYSLLAVLLTPSAALTPQRSAAQVATLGELSRSLQDLSQKVSTSVVQIFVTGFAPPDEDDPRGGGAAGLRAQQRVRRRSSIPTATS